MGRILVVHPRDLRDAQTALGAVLRQQRAALIVVADKDQPPSCANPQDLGLAETARNDQGEIAKLCRGADACFVACRPETEKELTSRFGIARTTSLGHKAQPIKAENYRIVQWLRAPPPPPPPPAPAVRPDLNHNYNRQARDGLDGHSRIIIAPDALKRASKIAPPIDDCVQFVEFVADAIRALRDVADGGARGCGLEALFRRYPAIEFAPSGNEVFDYGPVGTQRHRTTRHLKPNRELGGMRNPKQKPRLFFDVHESSDGTVVVYVLYLGPHPTLDVVQVDL